MIKFAVRLNKNKEEILINKDLITKYVQNIFFPEYKLLKICYRIYKVNFILFSS